MSNLAILGGAKTIDSDKARFVWPRITPDIEKAVIDQLRRFSP